MHAGIDLYCAVQLDEPQRELLSVMRTDHGLLMRQDGVLRGSNSASGGGVDMLGVAGLCGSGAKPSLFWPQSIGYGAMMFGNISTLGNIYPAIPKWMNVTVPGAQSQCDCGGPNSTDCAHTIDESQCYGGYGVSLKIPGLKYQIYHEMTQQNRSTVLQTWKDVHGTTQCQCIYSKPSQSGSAIGMLAATDRQLSNALFDMLPWDGDGEQFNISTSRYANQSKFTTSAHCFMNQDYNQLVPCGHAEFVVEWADNNQTIPGRTIAAAESDYSCGEGFDFGYGQYYFERIFETPSEQQLDPSFFTPPKECRETCSAV